MSPTALRLALLLVLVLGSACSSEPYPDLPETAQNMNAPYAPGPDLSPTRNDGAGQPVTLVDHGFRMPSGTLVIPRGWKVNQDIATDPNTGLVARFHLEYLGPQGELIKALSVSNYSPTTGTTFQQTWRQMVAAGLHQQVSDLALGDLRHSPFLERQREFQRTVQKSAPHGIQVQALEAPFRGRYQGHPVEGVAYVMHLTSLQLPGSGTVQASVVLAPADRLAETIRTHERISESFRPDPQHEQRQQQVFQAHLQRRQAAHEQWMANNQQWMANSQALHQQRMAANRAQFEAHQQMMQGRYEAADRQHAQFMDNLRSGGSSSYGSGSDYTSHNAFIDQIYERSTFDDPYSGYQVHRDGQYDYWYTNGQGDYYGTDDPNFDPYKLGNDWQGIEPLRPNP